MLAQEILVGIAIVKAGGERVAPFAIQKVRQHLEDAARLQPAQAGLARGSNERQQNRNLVHCPRIADPPGQFIVNFNGIRA